MKKMLLAFALVVCASTVSIFASNDINTFLDKKFCNGETPPTP